MGSSESPSHLMDVGKRLEHARPSDASASKDAVLECSYMQQLLIGFLTEKKAHSQYKIHPR